MIEYYPLIRALRIANLQVRTLDGQTPDAMEFERLIAETARFAAGIEEPSQTEYFTSVLWEDKT